MGAAISFPSLVSRHDKHTSDKAELHRMSQLYAMPNCFLRPFMNLLGVIGWNRRMKLLGYDTNMSLINLQFDGLMSPSSADVGKCKYTSSSIRRCFQKRVLIKNR